MSDILQLGESVDDRTGVGTLSLFGQQYRFDLRRGFPAVTTKKLAFKAMKAELAWFLSGSTNVEELRDLTHGVGSDKFTIWDGNYENQAVALGYENGELGPVYGKQWRNFGGVDQIAEVVANLKRDLETGSRSRRHIVSAWNPAELAEMALPPCHCFFQFHLNNKNELSLQWYQRSVDVFLGLPFNIGSYALLTHVVAQIIGATVGDLVFTGGDCHIYKNHIEQCKEQLSRPCKELPTLELPNFSSIEEFVCCNLDDVRLINYDPHPAIKAPMAV